MGSAINFSRLGVALRVDKVLSVPQVRRHYRILKKDLPPSYGSFASHVKDTYYAERVRKVSFVSLEGSSRRLSANDLRHLAGIAEMRHALGAASQSWSLHPRGETAVPDALWTLDGEKVAVEFDAGSYSRERIVYKAQAYGRFAAQVWGSSSQARLGFLQSVLGDLDIPATFIYAPWSH